MSQSFKLKYDEMRESNPTNEEPPFPHRSKVFEESYREESHARNICFVWQDGKRIFMNYSYLVSCEYSPEENTVLITFTSHIFILKGVNLEGLFYEIMHQVAKQITCMDSRYNVIGENEQPVVNDIQMKKEQ